MIYSPSMNLWTPYRGLGGTPGRMPIPPGSGTSTSPADLARGFISPADATAARDHFREAVGDMPWVPTAPTELGPWAAEQVKIFSSKEMTQGIENGKRVFDQKMSAGGTVLAETFPPMTEGMIEQWSRDYVEKNGFPSSPESAIAMGRAFVIANCDQIGLPPEFIAASDLIQNFPQTPETAIGWSISLSSYFLSSYGVPIVDVTDVSSFLSASARAAIAQVAPGVPFTLFDTTFEALSDGQLSGEEAKGIVIGAAGFIGGLIGQAFGLPAPIGALLSQLLVGGLVQAFGWGPSDSDKLRAAQSAAATAARQAQKECTALSTALWLEYQQYWDAITRDLTASIHENQDWLVQGSCNSTNGIRLFGSTTLDYVRDPMGNPIVSNPDEVKKGAKPKYRKYPYTLTRECREGKGCPYLSLSSDPIVSRDKFALSPSELKRVPSISIGGRGCDAASALAFWGAQRYVTPMHVVYAMGGKTQKWIEPSTYTSTQLTSHNVVPWDQILHSDSDYLNYIGYVGTYDFGTKVTACMAPTWASFMFRSLEQAAASVALVQRDLARTVSASVTEYGIQYHLEQAADVKWQVASAAQKRAAARAVAAKAAAYRHSIVEARRRGARTADLVNYGLLAAGSAALLGVFAGKR